MRSKSPWAKILPGYFTPLPPEIQKEVLRRAKTRGILKPGEGLFACAFGEVKTNENAMARLNTFLNLYGFCRNVAFVSLVITFILVIGGFVGGVPTRSLWAIAALATSVGLFYRYLKFHRQYSYELFVTYAALRSPEEKRGD